MAKLDALNNGDVQKGRERERRAEKDRGDKETREYEKERRARKREQHRKKKRIVSGAAMEEGKGNLLKTRGGSGGSDRDGKRVSRKCLYIGIAVFLLLLLILVPVGVLVVGKKNRGGAGGSGSRRGGEAPANTNLDSVSQSDIPVSCSLLPL